MKNSILLIVILFSSGVFGSEIDTVKLESQIKKVTVFFEGAQINREATIIAAKGKHLFVMDKLPAEINPQSIQIDNGKKGEILSVKHEVTYPESDNKITKDYEEKVKQLKIKLAGITNEIKVLDTEEKILLDNSVISKKNDGTTVAEIKDLAAYYQTKLSEIKQNRLKLSIDADNIKDDISKLYKELNQKIALDSKIYSKITFVLSSDVNINAKFNISYYISSAGWTPLYDFRVNSITDPLNLVYNASIYQTSGEDWNNVYITLSTNRPALSNDMPALNTWYIDHPSPKPVTNLYKNAGQSSIQGIITDEETYEPIPFANVILSQNGNGVSGTTTDVDGRYVFKPVNSGTYDIKVTYVGYLPFEQKSMVVIPNKTLVKDVKMKASNIMLEEYEVTDYNVPLINKADVSSGGVITSSEISRMPSNNGIFSYSTSVNGDYSKPQSIIYSVDGYESSSNISSLEYNIDIPYTIPSDGKEYNVKIKDVKVGVNYVFSCVPKLDKDAFLTCEITNWSQLNLLSGKASIYYNGVFTGNTQVDANYTKDTLVISLNRDRSIVVDRVLKKEVNQKQIIGKNILETVTWSITVRNTKTEKVNLNLEDQFPLAENTSFTIEKIEASNGVVDEKTGKVRWQLQLAPDEKKELILKYTVKYPNSTKIIVE